MPLLDSLQIFSKANLRHVQTTLRTNPISQEVIEEEVVPRWVRTATGWKEESLAGIEQQDSAAEEACTSKAKYPLQGTHAEKHGSLGSRNWPSPVQVTFCAVQARPGYLSCEAHEYSEASMEIMNEKVKMLASLLKRSKSTFLYTGAGLSTASGIPDYATRSSGSHETEDHAHIRISPLSARPTLSHRILVALHRAGFIKGWIQQNHDGLPQKAGYPQECINEIHGAWFDPSNPVVPMSGKLRDDLFGSLMQNEKEADLCLALGTSLAGMNADRIAISCAQRVAQGRSLGTVIVNLQRTVRDSESSLRIFGRLDEVLAVLAGELGISPGAYAEDIAGVQALMPSVPPDDLAAGVFQVPYDEAGRLRLADDAKEGARGGESGAGDASTKGSADSACEKASGGGHLTCGRGHECG